MSAAVTFARANCWGGVEARAAREDLAAQQTGQCAGEDDVVARGRPGLCEENDGDDDRGARQATTPAPPEAFGRLLEFDDARPATLARRGRQVIFWRMTEGHKNRES